LPEGLESISEHFRATSIKGNKIFDENRHIRKRKLKADLKHSKAGLLLFKKPRKTPSN
jgi:GH43 family beta-xylosidase